MELDSFDFLKQQDLPTGALYVVATPIGNLGDITLRALHILKAVEGIACEDTRHSVALLKQFGIHKKCLALHEHNEMAGAQTVIQHLANHERWAYISDAGTPGVSDPGARLVQAVHAAGFRVIPIPGASAVAAAVSVGGSVLTAAEGRFQFLGFLPNKTKERDALLIQIRKSVQASIFFESPHHIQDTLKLIGKALEPDRELMIGRELTKKFEQISFIRAADIPEWLTQSSSLKGEFVVMVAGRSVSKDLVSDDLLSLWVKALKPYLGSKEIAAVLSQTLPVSKKEAYQAAIDSKAGDTKK
ncbi:16S rRNA (cytidine(1402)-2'-O)-methyltransferase [Polynucleobacter paneuropaeus]|nr:16S rRNA (cytidine(1402)-2'-O)-methyltransferase [Polynucleobacter paneuropaeus]MBT8532674.1 16S rRNA (cytidine(1402)-2'-O)-methyltransferase [Polynucleobacter paneuropaeus]MBT8602888.1 16S rRNA (cytidine(1402)-2'-O)-methyltransferase [Polynucleobacter paneuropaeus]MBT8624495.1 16S rRNA (cytidine(1402)-2'-O)-methyltransferase [Polynucleobacter paneuropaeus]MBT8630395.1 16S rRNA (cytidine(1402)-2'-O)-methyltransferase [Polynucleobacter paneuropaeus]